MKVLGKRADRLYELREQRLELQKQVEALKAEETALTDELIRDLAAEGATSIAGKLARAGITKQEVGAVKDWGAFTAYVRETGAFELLQRRLNDGALRERWASEETVPGVVPFTVVKLSVTKAKG